LLKKSKRHSTHFTNDPHRTDADFREAFEAEFSGAFSDIVLVITDLSPSLSRQRGSVM
jgi:hypothetical protein